jgi:hypothetical protein
MIKKLILPATFIWLGLLIGISFIEAPLKFQAPGITIPLGLGIGRLVFSAMNKAELVLAALALFSVVNYPAFKKLGFFLVISIVLILLYQTFFLLPALDERATLVLQGIIIPSSYHHKLYVVLETAKLILLVVIGWFYLFKPNKNENRYSQSLTR